MNLDKRLQLLIGISVLVVLGLGLIEPISQDSSYHQFADTRTIAGIPNFFNVLSNLAFFAVGYLGMQLCLKASLKPQYQAFNKAYLLFFVGVLLTGLGSAYYHLDPDNSTLLWDRLPMTIAFMAFFCAVLGSCISPNLAHKLLYPVVILGIASTLYWHFTEQQGQGDLRPYILVQFLPIILLPLIMLLYDGKKQGCTFVWPILGLYILAKITELLDKQLYQILSGLSGHSIKHLLAALGIYFVYAAVRTKDT